MTALDHVSVEDAGNVNGSPFLLTDSIVNLLSKIKTLSSFSVNLTGSAGLDSKNGTFQIPGSLSRLKYLTSLDICSSDHLNSLTTRKNVDTLKMPPQLRILRISALSSQSPFVEFVNCRQLKKLDLTCLIDENSASVRHSLLNSKGLEELVYNSFYLSKNSDKYPPLSIEMENARLCFINERMKEFVQGLDNSSVFKMIDIKPAADFSYRFAVRLDKAAMISVKGLFLLNTISKRGNIKLESEGKLGKSTTTTFNIIPSGDSVLIALSLFNSPLCTLTITPETTAKQFIDLKINGDSISRLSLPGISSLTEYRFSALPNYINQLSVNEIDNTNSSSLHFLLDQFSKTKINIIFLPLASLTILETTPELYSNWTQVIIQVPAEKGKSKIIPPALAERIAMLNGSGKAKFSASAN
jgi:hypothetical protein